MKSLFALLLTLTALSGFSKDYLLTVRFSFKGIEEGYDHTNKIVVYIDDEKAAESTNLLQSEPNSVRVNIAEGKHTVKVENWAYYQGTWELHDKEHGYSQDLISTSDITVKKNVMMRILYDLDNGVEVSVK